MAMDVPLSNSNSSSSSNTSAQDDPVESCSDRDIHSRMVSEIGYVYVYERPYANRRMGRI